MKKNTIRKNQIDGNRKQEQAVFGYELIGKKVRRKPIGRDYAVEEFDPVAGEKIW